MIWFSFLIVILLLLLISVPGRKRKGKWRYRSIRWFFSWSKQRGWDIPSWLDEKFVFRIWLITFCTAVVLCMVSVWCSFEVVTKLEKPLNGQGTVWEDVQIVWKDEKGKEHTEQIQVEVKEQQLNEEEIEQIFSEIKIYLGKEILGDNESADFVNKTLYLPEQIEGYSAEISWNSDHPSIVNWDGTLGESIPEEGTKVKLTATICLQEQEQSFELQVMVFPPEKDWLDELNTTINSEKSEESWLVLPNEWNGVSIIWKKDRTLLLLFLTLLVLSVPVLLYFKKKQEIEEEEKMRRQQMLQDYPEIISKLMLLLSAGMSLRRAIEKIVSDYRGYHEKRAAYELLVEICKELHCGVTEKQAYERLGERCELLQYRTLSALLVQHLQKGNQGMEQILSEEVRQAEELRQQRAKIIGEQASAKLLFPMVLMLLDVFIILIVPAWVSFSI